jgi:DNA-binding PadR family transcriptional regulator
MNVARLMVLSLLLSEGPAHGHQVRRAAERTAGSGCGVNVGAIYRELHQLVAEGLIAPVCTEQPGRRPARTIYRITETGRAALQQLRAEAVGSVRLAGDAVQVALLFGHSVGCEGLADGLSRRHEAMRTLAADLYAERARLQSSDSASPLDLAVQQRRELLLDAELRWLQICAQTLVVDQAAETPSAPVNPSDNSGVALFAR